MTDYIDLNRANWDDRALAHALSPDYDVRRLVGDPSAISSIVELDRERLGDLNGQDVVHLQCHIGTDTLSLKRLGARSVTGVDLSPKSLQEARRIADEARVEVEYVEAEVSDAPTVLGDQRFDLVYTGVGALCWLPSVRRWAQTVATLLRPGGRLLLREFHPVLWAIDETQPELVLTYPYFEQPDPLEWDSPETYVETDHVITATRTAEWNHGLGEIVTALLQAGLRLDELTEYDSAPEQVLPGRMRADGPAQWRLVDRPARLPASYTLHATKPS